MERRVRRILLVCNNYDSFALEEDGRIDVQIAQEYTELNISNPPTIIRAETTREALNRVEQGEEFDLILTMYSAGEFYATCWAVHRFASYNQCRHPCRQPERYYRHRD